MKINRRVISVTSVLLILSVMIFVGSAAAAVSASDRTASNTSINPGETVNITVDVQTDQSGDDVLINDSFSGPVSSATGSVVESANGTATASIDKDGS